ncbi:MAG: hypothetical protein U1E82_07475 [Nitrosomonas sp.]|nr:hypothetical protein [Nitrosomonas sp.]
MAALSLAQLGALPQSWPSLTVPSLSQVASSHLPSVPSGHLQKVKTILLLFLSVIGITSWIICDWLDDKIDEGATRINLYL